MMGHVKNTVEFTSYEVKLKPLKNILYIYIFHMTSVIITQKKLKNPRSNVMRFGGNNTLLIV